MRWLVILPVLGILSAVVWAVYVRTAGHDPARWHVDPATVTEVNANNEFLGSAVLEGTSDTVSAGLKGVLGGEVLVGSYEEGWVTLVVRTPLYGYPDYVSVRIEERHDDSEVTIFSRSRFGYSDLGMNKDRVEKTFAALKAR